MAEEPFLPHMQAEFILIPITGNSIIFQKKDRIFRYFNKYIKR